MRAGPGAFNTVQTGNLQGGGCSVSAIAGYVVEKLFPDIFIGSTSKSVLDSYPNVRWRLHSPLLTLFYFVKY
ncbi:hypothetical protein EBB07_20505 [Paenibacillaceae bacterium]|nr:hypothetical protein EBB07_20505 [Paenibacillaceae bacterium]